MAAESERQSGAEPTPTLAPGAMAALLRELADAPEAELPRARSLHPGSVVGRFELLRELGRGGFGVVYEARDSTLGRLVAFKAVRPGPRTADLLRQKWLWHEAETAAQLSHPNIVTLYDVGTSDAGPYLVLELLHGKTLAEIVHAHPVPWQRALAIGVGVARALAYAHAAGVVHRDLKPANVFVTDDERVKVLDFGLAHVLGTSALAGGGTPSFMAPEQWRGGPEDARTDSFGLGATLFAALTGRPPYDVGEGRSSALDGAPAPRPHQEGCPHEFADLVQRCLAADPSTRPSDGAALLEGLIAIERRVAAPAPRAFGIRWALPVVAAVLLAVLAVILVRRPPPAPPRGSYVVAVADVLNETGEPDLDSLSGLLITSLEQSRRVRVLTRTRLRDSLRAMGHGGTAHVDQEVSKAAAARAGANALLVPVVRRFGSLYSIEVRALDTASESYLFGIEERGPERQSIPAMIDRVSERTRRMLKESTNEIDRDRIVVARSVTADLEAYRHYFLGIACYDGLGQGCDRHFRRALELDPAFALAQYQLAYLAEFGAAPLAEQRQAFDTALEFIDRFPARERMYMLAWQAHLKGEDAKALTLYAQLVAAYPDDKDAHYLAGDLHFHLDQPELAIPYFRRALELDSSALNAVIHLADALAISGRNDELVALARERLAAFPGTGTQMLVAIALGQAGDPAALEVGRRAAVEGEPAHAGVELRFQNLLNAFGRHAEAEVRARALTRRLLAGEAPGTRYRVWAHVSVASALAYQGRRREAQRILDSAKPPTSRAEQLIVFHASRVHLLAGDGGVAAMHDDLMWLRENAPHYGSYAVLLAYLGQLDAAADAAARLRPGSLDERTYRAVLRWRRGDPSGAADELAPLASRIMARGLEQAYEPWLHAEALAEAGRDAEAIEALRRFQRILVWPGPYRSWAYPRSLFLLARAHARRGERDEAVQNLDTLLKAWREADADLPLLRDARELRRRLVTDSAIHSYPRP